MISEASRNRKNLNKYGVPVDVWETYSRKQRTHYYRRYAHQLLMATPEGREKYRAGNAAIYAKRKLRIESDPAYRAKRAAQNKAAYERHYWRFHEKQVAKHRRRWAATKSRRQITLSPDAVFRMIDKAVSRSLPRHVRDDVISAMCLAVLEGQLFVEHIEKEAQQFLRAHNRMFDHFKTVSLDAPVRGSEDMTLLDTLAAPEMEAAE